MLHGQHSTILVAAEDTAAGAPSADWTTLSTDKRTHGVRQRTLCSHNASSDTVQLRLYRVLIFFKVLEYNLSVGLLISTLVRNATVSLSLLPISFGTCCLANPLSESSRPQTDDGIIDIRTDPLSPEALCKHVPENICTRALGRGSFCAHPLTSWTHQSPAKISNLHHMLLRAGNHFSVVANAVQPLHWCRAVRC